MIVLDTDVISAVMRAEPRVADWLDRQPPSSIWTTTITIFELRYGIAIMAPGRRRSAVERAFENVIDFELSGRVLAFDRLAAEQTAVLMALRHSQGRMKASADTMIAGIAIANNAVLATRNVAHLDDLRMPIIDPWLA